MTDSDNAAAAPDAELPPDFETALAELDDLLERMEGGDLPLEASLAAFERGIRLTRHCQQALTDAEQRVRVLLEQEDGTLTTAAAEAPDAGDDA